MDEKLRLLRPDADNIGQYGDYRREFLENGDSMDGTGPMRRCERADEWLARVRSYESPDTLPEGLVIATQYMLVRESDGRLLGMLQLRHTLNDYLAKYAGHIGYSVRPSERRKGYAKSMLKACLPYCRELGLRRILISCVRGNEASARTILANGGVYESTVYCEANGVELERYWIDLDRLL